MSVDILIFAVIAAILIYRLNGVLGTRNGDEPSRKNPFDEPSRKNPFDEPSRKNPFDEPSRSSPLATQKVAKPVPVGGNVLSLKPNPSAPAVPDAVLVDPASDAEGKVSVGLEEIASVDHGFDAAHFMAGAEYAFNLIVESYAKGDRAKLKPLLSQKLYADFDRGISARESSDTTAAAPPAVATSVRSIKSARITEAHLGGTMAYVTVEYHVSQAALTDGTEEDVTDIWTFTRDTRSSDPNWILIETRTAEK